RLPSAQAKKIINAMVKLWFPLHWAVRNFFPAQAILSRFSPVLFYYRAYRQLSKEELYEFSQLDTFDSLTDYYKHLRTVNQIRSFLLSLGGTHIHVVKGGNGVEARCQKPTLFQHYI